jgi:hypothetical protein
MLSVSIATGDAAIFTDHVKLALVILLRSRSPTTSIRSDSNRRRGGPLSVNPLYLPLAAQDGHADVVSQCCDDRAYRLDGD